MITDHTSCKIAYPDYRNGDALTHHGSESTLARAGHECYHGSQSSTYTPGWLQGQKEQTNSSGVTVCYIQNILDTKSSYWKNSLWELLQEAMFGPEHSVEGQHPIAKKHFSQPGAAQVMWQDKVHGLEMQGIM